MSVHLLPRIPAELPRERRLLKESRVRLIEETERARFDQLLEEEAKNRCRILSGTTCDTPAA